MKMKEFLTEEELKDVHSSTLPGAYYYPELQSSNPYDTYRFGMGMADHTIFHPNGPTKNAAVIVAYSDAEEEIISATEKKLGKKGKKTLADKGSKEPNGTNTTSPVAKKKKNKYGV
jgi:hypothetical protein